MSVLSFTDPRHDGRYSAHVTYEPMCEGDPIPYLVTIYDAEADTALASFWRGDESEGEQTLMEYVSDLSADE